MLSVCIPIYNVDVSSLVIELEKQINSIPEKIELLLIDDCSEANFKEKNSWLAKSFKYIELTQNIGRSSIRNLFLEYVNYEYLLFMDCDSLITSPQFLANYISSINQGNDVICGGRVYPEDKPNRNYRLRWKYGKYRESKSASERSKHPNQSFLTNNFVVKKDILTRIRFDESLKEYGHEDTLFGFELKQQNIAIAHIENPILNGDFETNRVFISNTEKGIKNLVNIIQKLDHRDEFIEDVRLLRTYQQLKNVRFLIRIAFLLSQWMIKKLLSAGCANLTLFSFYKLGFLDREIRNC